jgi:hypothetical protein
MKFRLALFLAGASLLVAMPLFAEKYVPGPNISDKDQLVAAPRADFELDSANNEGMRDNGIRQFNQPVADSDSSESGAFSSASSDGDVHRDMKLHSIRGGSGESSTLGSRPDGDTSVVPEPESVSLVLLGLVAIASISFRRR